MNRDSRGYHDEIFQAWSTYSPLALDITRVAMCGR
jgi:hypothetical protein